MHPVKVFFSKDVKLLLHRDLNISDSGPVHHGVAKETIKLLEKSSSQTHSTFVGDSHNDLADLPHSQFHTVQIYLRWST